MGIFYPHKSEFKGEWPWKDFTPAEVSCKHCGEFYYDPQSMDAIQRLRDAWGKPIVITSAHRCDYHNRKVGGAALSKHLRIAFDCVCPRNNQEAFAKAAKLVGFTGIIKYPARGFVHLDLRETPYEDVRP